MYLSRASRHAYCNTGSHRFCARTVHSHIFSSRPKMYLLVSLFLWGSCIAVLMISPVRFYLLSCLRHAVSSWYRLTPGSLGNGTKHDIKPLVECHTTAALLNELIATDGAGDWPPRANHDHVNSWPGVLRPYKTIYLDLAPLLPQDDPSQDDSFNLKLISEFRSRYWSLLRAQIDLEGVLGLLKAAEAGRWDLFPRDIYNAFYCCVASSRHMYRWGVVPVVKVAQLEQFVELPPELVQPWTFLQRHFGCTSSAGNLMANMVLNFHCDALGTGPIFRINTSIP